MINFRYHLVSLIAIFLALGIGVVMGSTVIDRAIVDGLQNRIDKAEKNSIERKAENERLNTILENQNNQVTALAGHTVAHTLENNNVFIVTVGSIPSNVLTDTQELIGVSGARLGGVIDMDEGFVRNDPNATQKAQLAKDLRQIENVSTLVGSGKTNGEQISLILMEMLNLQAGGTSDIGLPLQPIEDTINKANILSINERPQNYDPYQPVSFILLVQRSEMGQMAVKGFVTHFISRFPVTVGFVGNETDKPNRDDAILSFQDRLGSFSIVDNTESPSGRITLFLAHAQNIAGTKGVYGISKKTNGYTPDLTS